MGYLYAVYWIHLPDQLDPFLTGYVGVSNNVEKRWRRHQLHAEVRPAKRNSYPLYRAFRDVGIERFLIDVLFTGLDKESAHNLEYALRPAPGIGYNLDVGGFWRSCSQCSSLTPLRSESERSHQIDAHIAKALAYLDERAVASR